MHGEHVAVPHSLGLKATTGTYVLRLLFILLLRLVSKKVSKGIVAFMLYDLDNTY